MSIHNEFTIQYDHIKTNGVYAAIGQKYRAGNNFFNFSDFYLGEYLYTNKNQILKEEQIKKWMIQFLLSLNSIHQKNSYHSNIKLENIIVFGDNNGNQLVSFDYFIFGSILSKNGNPKFP